MTPCGLRCLYVNRNRLRMNNTCYRTEAMAHNKHVKALDCRLDTMSIYIMAKHVKALGNGKACGGFGLY